MTDSQQTDTNMGKGNGGIVMLIFIPCKGLIRAHGPNRSCFHQMIRYLDGFSYINSLVHLLVEKECNQMSSGVGRQKVKVK